jgi:hypothetical protein
MVVVIKVILGAIANERMLLRLWDCFQNRICKIDRQRTRTGPPSVVESSEWLGPSSTRDVHKKEEFFSKCHCPCNS